MRLTIPGLPISTNHLYKHTGRVLKSERAQAYGWKVKEAIRDQNLLDLTFDGLLCLQADLYVHRWEDIDGDNGCKGLIDFLAAIYGFDDAHIIDLRVRKHLVVSRDDVRCEVSLMPYQEGE